MEVQSVDMTEKTENKKYFVLKVIHVVKGERERLFPGR